MIFEWDPEKERTNIAKHGVGFTVAQRIFEGPVVTAEDRRFSYGERREISIGRVEGSTILTVVHTDRYGRTRLISARLASRKERLIYERSIREGLDG